MRGIHDLIVSIGMVGEIYQAVSLSEPRPAIQPEKRGYLTLEKTHDCCG